MNLDEAKKVAKPSFWVFNHFLYSTPGGRYAHKKFGGLECTV